MDGSSTGIGMYRIAVVIQEQRMTGNGTIQPVVDPPINGRCQGNSCHWMQVRLIYAQELPFRMPCRIAVLDPNWPLCVLPLSIERLTLSYMYGSSSFE